MYLFKRRKKIRVWISGTIKNVNISTFHSNQIKSCVETNCVQISHLEIQQSLVTDRGENEQKRHIFLFHAAWKTRSLM